MSFMARFLSGWIQETIGKKVYTFVKKEYDEIYQSLKFRANTAYLRLKEMDSVTSNPV